MKIDDIARLAGVSKSAVSLALNNKAGVSEATRQHILEISRQNGYIPRTFKSNKVAPKNNTLIRFIACKNVDIVTEHYESQPFFNELIHHLMSYAGEQGHTLVISSVSVQNLNKEIETLESEQSSAGILLLGTNLTADMIESVLSVHKNVVVMDTCLEQVDASIVGINNYLGGYQAGRFLLGQGYKSIGYVQSDVRIVNFIKRKQGFEAALKEGGLQLEDKLTYYMNPMSVVSQPSFKAEIEQIKANSKAEQLPEAIFCENDYMAISAIKTFQELGIKVPEEVAVMGFDNIFEAEIISPELTTIQVKKDVMAKTAMDVLLQKVNHADASHRSNQAEPSHVINDGINVQVYVNTEVIVRKSTSLKEV
ncbi:LacI family transcriptional regulator [Paenibacillus turicensis]|uniref:LacI family transcriptional regulator n=1 Tax=Paenibacillus turicensis TaxID=160487 RepID=A0ABS4FVB0_9BACL|nr:LacI family transcriptional regulator [Paenibacillus turicensis]